MNLCQMDPEYSGLFHANSTPHLKKIKLYDEGHSMPSVFLANNILKDEPHQGDTI